MEKEIIIATATAMEMRAVCLGLGIDEPPPEPRLERCRVASARGYVLRLVVTGVGPLAAAFAAGRLTGEGIVSTCRGVLNLGIAGTYIPAVAPLGSLARATREVWPEYGLVTEHGVDPVALGFPLSEKKGAPCPTVWDKIDLDMKAYASMGLNDPGTTPELPESPLVVSGPSVTVAGVSGTRTRAQELAARYTALTENMEGFPLALAALNMGVPFAELRAISNIVGDRTPSAWNIPAALAALTRSVALTFS